jgi:excisionase family DNA binding protein
MDVNDSPTVNVAEAARLLGCSTRNIHRLIAIGQLPARKFGTGETSPYMIRRTDIDRLARMNSHIEDVPA